MDNATKEGHFLLGVMSEWVRDKVFLHPFEVIQGRLYFSPSCSAKVEVRVNMQAGEAVVTLRSKNWGVVVRKFYGFDFENLTGMDRFVFLMHLKNFILFYA